jgi:predicted nucleotidyltransferase
MAIQISIDPRAIADFCQRHHIRTLGVFGSALRDDFGPDSDVDLLVEFEPGHVPGLISLAGMELELEDIVGRPVDLPTLGGLSRYFRESVAATVQPLYGSE